jgi:hypothetical protein
MASDYLLSLREVTDRLSVVGQHYVGMRTIPIDRIVGSVDRSVAFDRFFHLAQCELRQRPAQLRRVFADRPMPPISVYEASDLYFVSDGHHRVALARRMAASSSTPRSLHSSWPELHPQVYLLELVHTEQHCQFKERSGLLQIHPEAHMTSRARPATASCLEIAEAHAYQPSMAGGTIVPMPEATADWYETS